MKYEPKTTEWMRQNNWGAEAQQLVTTDLTACESCLAEAEREVERQRGVLRELGVSGGDDRKSFPGVRVDGWAQVGGYALAFTFSDGHKTGIYSYGYLKEISRVLQAG